LGRGKSESNNYIPAKLGFRWGWDELKSPFSRHF
jgi:hypothetical protein